MPGFTQDIDRSAVFFWDQHVVGVESRNGEDWNGVVRQRLDEGKQHSGLREGERAFEFQADPAVGRVNIRRKIGGGADDGEFVGGAGDGGEVTLGGIR